MENLKYLELQIAINCGSYECLAACCHDVDGLTRIHRLMNGLAVRDIPTLSRMLCCRVPQTDGGGSGSGTYTPPAGGGTGTGAPADLRNCWQRLRDYACQHRLVLSAIPALVVAVTAVFPELLEGSAVILTGVAELTADCDAKTPEDESTLGHLVQEACYINNAIREFRTALLGKTPEVVKPLIELLDKYVVGLATLDFCCPAGSQPNPPKDQSGTPALPAAACGSRLSPAFRWST